MNINSLSEEQQLPDARRRYQWSYFEQWANCYRHILDVSTKSENKKPFCVVTFNQNNPAKKRTIFKIFPNLFSVNVNVSETILVLKSVITSRPLEHTKKIKIQVHRFQLSLRLKIQRLLKTPDLHLEFLLFEWLFFFYN